MNRQRWQQASNILCVRLDTLGDVLLCTPAMRAIRKARPGRKLSLLTSRSGAAVAPYIPELDAVLRYAAPWVEGSAPHPPMVDAAMVQSLAALQFDAAVIFTSYSQSALPAALLCYLAGIPLRLAHCRENPGQLLSDWVEDHEPGRLLRHEMQRQLDLVAVAGWEAESFGLSFAVPEEDVQRVRHHFAEQGIGRQQRVVLMHPGAGTASRRYPSRWWASLICGLWQRGGYAIVLAGERRERDWIAEIAALCRVPVHALAGRLTVGQTGAAMRLASVVVANDTDPAQMAAAIGTPLVDLQALTRMAPEQLIDAICSMAATAPAAQASSRECLGSLADK